MKQEIREMKRLDQQKRDNTDLDFQFLLNIQNQEKKLREKAEAVNLCAIKKKAASQEFEESKQRKMYENVKDKLKNTSIYEDQVKQQINLVEQSMKSLKLNITEKEAEIKNIEELEYKQKRGEGEFRVRNNHDEERKREERRSASPVLANADMMIPLKCKPYVDGRNVRWDQLRVDEEEENLDDNDNKNRSKENKQSDSLNLMKEQLNNMCQKLDETVRVNHKLLSDNASLTSKAIKKR